MTQPKHCAETRLAEMQKREQRMIGHWNEVFDVIEFGRCASRRSGGLRPEPFRLGLSAPAAIAKEK